LSIFKDEDISKIEKNLNDNINFIWLNRENIYERVVSDYFACYLNIWSLRKTEMQKIRFFYTEKVPFNEKKIISKYNQHLEYQNNNWNNLLVNRSFLKIEYENFTKKTFEAIKNIFNYLHLEYSGINFKKIIYECPLISSKRSESEDYVQRLKNIIEN
jgi:LPS sulfotransferase NodH